MHLFSATTPDAPIAEHNGSKPGSPHQPDPEPTHRPVRILLAKAATGKYLRPLRQWTVDRELARDFQSVSQALAEVHRHSLVGMEVVLVDPPAQSPGGRRTKLTLARLLTLKLETKS